MFLTTGVYAGAVAIYSSSHQHLPAQQLQQARRDA